MQITQRVYIIIPENLFAASRNANSLRVKSDARARAPTQCIYRGRGSRGARVIARVRVMCAVFARIPRNYCCRGRNYRGMLYWMFACMEVVLISGGFFLPYI